MSTSARAFSRKFKLAALDRMASGENVSALSRELGIRRKLLYAWRDGLRRAGPEGLRGAGRPKKAAVNAPAAAVRVDPVSAQQARIAELERKVGQQALELDFFRAALQQVGGPRRRRGVRGEPGSTP